MELELPHVVARESMVLLGMVVFPFSSGILLAVDVATGAEVWSAAVSGKRLLVSQLCKCRPVDTLRYNFPGLLLAGVLV